MFDRRRGFTLLELLVLLGLLGVVVLASIPHASAMRSALELRSAALRVASELTRARYGALAEGRAWWVRIVDESTLEVGPEGGATTRSRLPGQSRFVASTSGGDVRFQPNGWGENATFTIGRGAGRRSVVVNQRGRVEMRLEDAS